MRWFSFLLSFSICSLADGGEFPDFEGFSDENFEKREEVAAEVLSWITANPQLAINELLKRYLGEEDPEVRARLLPLLERAYFPLKGYVGIVMRPFAGNRLKFRQQRQGGQEAPAPLGVLITRVVENTPAVEAGLKVDDILVKVRDWQADNAIDLNEQVAREIQKNAPGSEIPLTIVREGETITITLKLGILPPPSEIAKDSARDPEGGVSAKVRGQLAEFQSWLKQEIDKEEKNLIAGDRS